MESDSVAEDGEGRGRGAGSGGGVIPDTRDLRTRVCIPFPARTEVPHAALGAPGSEFLPPQENATLRTGVWLSRFREGGQEKQTPAQYQLPIRHRPLQLPC